MRQLRPRVDYCMLDAQERDQKILISNIHVTKVNSLRECLQAKSITIPGESNVKRDRVRCVRGCKAGTQKVEGRGGERGNRLSQSLLFYSKSQLTWGLGLISHWKALGILSHKRNISADEQLGEEQKKTSNRRGKLTSGKRCRTKPPAPPQRRPRPSS